MLGFYGAVHVNTVILPVNTVILSDDGTAYKFDPTSGTFVRTELAAPLDLTEAERSSLPRLNSDGALDGEMIIVTAGDAI